MISQKQYFDIRNRIIKNWFICFHALNEKLMLTESSKLSLLQNVT